MRRHFALHGPLAAAAFALAALAAGSAGAQPTSPPPAPSGATATISRNVYVAGGEARTTAPVAGDFAAAGGRVIVDQPVGSDAALAGGSVEVKAPVGDDLRAAGGDVNISSTVGGDLLAVGGNVVLTPAAVVARDASLHAGRISMGGRIDGSLQANADRIVIDGEVRGDARLRASRIELGPKARIAGALHYLAEAELVKADGATVVGPITREDMAWTRAPERQPRADRPARNGWIRGVAAYLGVLAVAALFLLVAPVYGTDAAQRVRATPWSALGLGFATLLALPVLAMLLVVSVLGIPIALAVLALYPVALMLGFVVSVLYVALLLPPAFRLPRPHSFGATMGAFALALLLVLVVARIPFIGAVLVGLVALAGLGAGVLELYGRRKRPAGPSGGARVPAQPAPPSGDDMAGAQA